jgi:hypothetical protein
MQPSNLLFILSDNHARAAMGCASGGLVRTPHLDALARRAFRDRLYREPDLLPRARGDRDRAVSARDRLLGQRHHL